MVLPLRPAVLVVDHLPSRRPRAAATS